MFKITTYNQKQYGKNLIIMENKSDYKLYGL